MASGLRPRALVGTDAVYLWDGESGKEVAVLRGHTALVTSVLFSPDGSRLVSGSNYPDNTARLWDAATGAAAGCPRRTQEFNHATVAFSPDGKRVATASRDQTARLWDGRTGQSLAVLGGHTEHGAVMSSSTRTVRASSPPRTMRHFASGTPRRAN